MSKSQIICCKSCGRVWRKDKAACKRKLISLRRLRKINEGNSITREVSKIKRKLIFKTGYLSYKIRQ
jgi:hypothetical protein